MTTLLTPYDDVFRLVSLAYNSILPLSVVFGNETTADLEFTDHESFMGDYHSLSEAISAAIEIPWEAKEEWARIVIEKSGYVCELIMNGESYTTYNH